MIKHQKLCFLLSAEMLLISSCSTAYVETPDLREELGYSYETEKKYVAQEEWWKGYNNHELNRLIETALQNNTDYLKAAININKELYRLNLAVSDLFPLLSGGFSASSQKQLDTGEGFTNNFSAEGGLNYEIDLYGKIRDLKSAQEFEYQATIMDKESARLSLINSVIDLYFNLCYLKDSIELTKENIKTYEAIQNITEQKFLSGRSDDLEFLESKQSVITEKNRLLDLETQFKEMEISLMNILNIKSGEPFSVSYENILQQSSIEVDTDVPVSVLANRPDLLASQYRLEEAFKSLKSEEKSWYPSITIGGIISSSSTTAGTIFDFPYILGNISVDLPFLDWNRVKNNIKISEADYQIAVLDFKDTLNQAVNEVANYYFAYSKYKELYKNTEENYQNAVKITAYYDKRYNNGKIEFRDFLTAINSENSLKKDLIQQKYQIIKYENYIFKAMAGQYVSAED